MLYSLYNIDQTEDLGTHVELNIPRQGIYFSICALSSSPSPASSHGLVKFFLQNPCTLLINNKVSLGEKPQAPPKLLPMVVPLPLPPAFGHGGGEPGKKGAQAGGLRLRLSAWLEHSGEVLPTAVEAEHLTHAAIAALPMVGCV
jgi:hypothetical protein